MSHKARREYFRAIYGRYQKGNRKARQAILNEFCLNTGYHRKYAIRLLNGANPVACRLYSPESSKKDAVRWQSVLTSLAQLKALTPDPTSAGNPPPLISPAPTL